MRLDERSPLLATAFRNRRAPARINGAVYRLYSHVFIGYIKALVPRRCLCALQMDPEGEGPLLPRNGAEEFKPFRGRVGEFSFW